MATSPDSPRSQSWPVATLQPNPLNPRTEIQTSGLDELAASIRAQGVLQPLLVTPQGVVVAGHRRLAAARLAGLETVPVLVHDLDPVRQQEIMLVENLQRADLSAVAEARAYRRLLDAGHTTANLARRLGVTTSRINARVLLLKLDEHVQWMVDRGDLPLTLAPILLRVTDPGRQRQIATMAARRQLTVPELERIVERGAGALQAPAPKSSLPPEELPKQGLSPSRVAALQQLEESPVAQVFFGDLATLFRECCCACGMDDLPTYCRECPMLDLVNRVLARGDKKTGRGA